MENWDSGEKLGIIWNIFSFYTANFLKLQELFILNKISGYLKLIFIGLGVFLIRGLGFLSLSNWRGKHLFTKQQFGGTPSYLSLTGSCYGLFIDFFPIIDFIEWSRLGWKLNNANFLSYFCSGLIFSKNFSAALPVAMMMVYLNFY